MSDYTSKDVLFEAIEELTWYHPMQGEMVEGAKGTGWYKSEDIFKAIDAIPTADVVERKRATDKGYENSYGWVDVCSLCGCEFTTSRGANYCPNCGARLDDEEYEQEIIDARKGEE